MALDARQPDHRHQTQLVRESVRHIDPTHPGAGAWAAVRGDILMRTTVELSGGFPGSASCAGSLRQARFAISEDWLIVNEGRPDGFALPLDLVDAFSVVPGSLRSRYALRIRYLLHDRQRFFYVKFPEPVWPFRAGDEALRVAELLYRLGIDDLEVSASASIAGQLIATDANTRSAALESMVWSGDISAPVHGRKGQDRTRCQVWLTTSTLIWKAMDGSGMHRLKLSSLAAVHTGMWVVREPVPVAILLIPGGDAFHELPIVFDAFDHVEDNRRECAAMLGGLRMRDIAVSSQPRPLHPWQDVTSLLAATDLANAPGPLPTSPAPASHRTSPAEFEAQCLAEIARLNRDILGEAAETHVAPVHLISQAMAMEELERLYRCGELSQNEWQKRRLRVTALVEARGKLAAIADQRAKGHRPKAILQHQRDAVMSHLNAILMPESANTPVSPDSALPRMRLRVVK